MPPSGSSSRPGLPTWARQSADWLFGDPNEKTGVYADAVAGQKGVDFNNLLAGMQPSLAAANAGGSMQREIASQLIPETLASTQKLAGDSVGNLNQQNVLMGQVPNLFSAANQFAGNINQGENIYQSAAGSAQQSLNNVMDPTYYNPLFQNYAKQLVSPINAQFSARGLGSSGAPIAATTAAQTDLGSKFAERQFQEQMAAQGNLTNIGRQFVDSGVAGAQIPGQVFNQFMSGYGQAQQNLNQASQNQLMPLNALGMGSEQFWQGVNNPIATGGSMYEISRDPMKTLMGGTVGAMGGITSPPSSGFLGKVMGK